MDHWDMIVAFDSAKHRQEEAAFQKAGKGSHHAKFKGVLDNQMEEFRMLKEQEAADKRREREDMSALLAENKRLEQAAQEAEHRKKSIQQKSNDEMTAGIVERRRKEQQKKQREQEQMLSWLESEKKKKEEEEIANKELHALKCKVARESLDVAREEAARKKKAEQDMDVAIAAAQVKAMDNAEANNKAGVQARMDQIEKNCSTLGAEIAGRDARIEAELQEKIKRVQEEADRVSKEDRQRRATNHAKKVQEMVATLDDQMRERELAKVADKEADLKQAIKFKEEFEEGLRKDKAAEEKRRKARENLDGNLIAQIRANVAVHPKNCLVTHESQKVDLAYNRVLFEQMASEGYREDVAGELLGKARHGGKLDPFPSVGRYDGPIHPLEMQVPDV